MNNRKSNLKEVRNLDNVEYIVVLDKGNEIFTKVPKADFDALYEVSSTNGGVKEYIANVSQGGTNAPTATVLKNTLGGTPTWGYSGTGEYTLTLTGGFADDASKVHILVGQSQDGNLEVMYGYRNDANTLIFDCFEQTGTTPTNGLLSNSPIHIRVFS